MAPKATLGRVAARAGGLTPQEARALDALADADIEAAAAADPDAQPWSDASLDQAAIERRERLDGTALARRTRALTGLGQDAFARKYRINVSRLRDWEQGRHAPDSVALAYLQLIAHDPEGVARVLGDDAA